MATVSIIIITKNEEQNIRACLESVAWSDEIIIVDSGSSDKTLDICRTYTDKIFFADWHGFGKQKNFALSKATSDWILSIDADERITDELRMQIQEAITQRSSVVGYYLLRSNIFCGKKVKYTRGWAKDRVLRLIKRGAGRFSDVIVHEQLTVSGTKRTLSAPMLHYSYRNLDDVLRKINLYSSESAELYKQQGKRICMSGIILKTIWSFLRVYFVDLAFLDGKIGFIIAVNSCVNVFYKYAKLNLYL